MGRVNQNRWTDGEGWESLWELYNDLTSKHPELGQDIDFTNVRRSMETLFIFDMVQKQHVMLKGYLRLPMQQAGKTAEVNKDLIDHIETNFELLDHAERRQGRTSDLQVV